MNTPSLRERLAADREKRIEEARQERVVRNAETGARPINHERLAEARRTFQELQAPTLSESRRAAADPPILDSVEFYCYDSDGDLATIRIFTEGATAKV